MRLLKRTGDSGVLEKITLDQIGGLSDPELEELEKDTRRLLAELKRDRKTYDAGLEEFADKARTVGMCIGATLGVFYRAESTKELFYHILTGINSAIHGSQVLSDPSVLGTMDSVADYLTRAPPAIAGLLAGMYASKEIARYVYGAINGYMDAELKSNTALMETAYRKSSDALERRRKKING